MTLDAPFLLKILRTVLCALAVAAATTPLAKWLAKKLGAVDVPRDGRRMHDHPIPRMGGLAIILGFLTAVLLFLDIDREVRGILIGAGIIAILGMFDDIYDLHAGLKFLVQIGAAIVVTLHGCRIEHISGWQLPLWLSYPVSVLWIVALTNAVNFIDGLDGLAAGVCAICASSMLIVALLAMPDGSAGESAILLAAVAGACIGFIPYNFNPAKIFMGDTGSTFLGFVLSSVSIYGLFKTYAAISFAAPFLVLGLPIFDVCYAVIRRVSHGVSPMHADRSHMHHKLIDLGFSQKQAVAICYLISAMLGLAAVVLTGNGFVQALVFLAALLLAGFVGVRIFAGKRREPTREDKNETD